MIDIGRFEPCPPNGLCVPIGVGVVGEGRLDLQSGLWGGVSVYVWR